MKILILGGGGREHALVWKLRQSTKVKEVICLPGNGADGKVNGIYHKKDANVINMLDFAVSQGVDLTVVGPDDALADGVVDLFEAAGQRIFGPTQAAAKLESSKIFAKEFMVRHGIPTARSGHFYDAAAARAFLQTIGCPVVIKADGLALGKGVLIAQTAVEAEEAIHRLMENREFGDAGAAVVIEEFLVGQECSIHALVDGKSYLLFPGAQDHKRAFNGETGPNTGGMGTCSPVPILSAAMHEMVKTEVLDRFLAGIQADGIHFRGMLFPGIMITADGLKVLEFNCRFGDPETQVLLPRLKTDLVDLLEATIDGRLETCRAEWDERAAVCVVLASGGYPESYTKGHPITGIDAAEAEGALVFQAGTAWAGDELVTSGGRVLGVTALGANIEEAREKAYYAARRIEFAGKFFRDDIGLKSI